ncbi:hypothetical protein [Qipengyuania qiaonensis]|uniref:Uncharacterized protein n=1 Tax=Qipengyuania qiaonensis TaxID=2867240 RepID=A0ABS7J5W8_9SPHN|nr:hypothetical protein [Qipengyuania qiaonensis]MBX7482702.1 hypothetical protein [Qipengyuania qiaonensis]
MPVHFAAARSTAHSPIARALAKKALARAANDNGDSAQVRAEAGNADRTMHAALKHFAEHGLGAAKVAWRQAEQAHSTGDIQTYEWWFGICRTLDRRLAKRCAEEIALRSLLTGRIFK